MSEGLSEKMDKLIEAVESSKMKKTKKFKLPLKARVRKSKLNKGYVTVQIIDENKNINFVRKPIVDGTIKLDDTVHAVDELDIFTYKGKPFVLQPKHRMNPFNPISTEKETYGHKYVMARMKSDAIKAGAKKISGMAILIIIGIIVGAYYFISGGSG